jgi:hypothetical protein
LWIFTIQGLGFRVLRKKGLDTGGVNPPEADKLFEELATSSWNLAAGVQTPEKGHRSEPI